MQNIFYITLKKCDKCGGCLEVRSDVILPTYPVKYEAKCKDCNNIEYLCSNEVIASTQNVEKEPRISNLSPINTDDLVIPSLHFSPCIICGDHVEIITSYTGIVICENCKQAILKVRFGQLKTEIIDEINKERKN